MDTNQGVVVTQPFTGRARRLDERAEANEADKHNKIKVSADIRSVGKGVIKTAKYHNLSLNEKLMVSMRSLTRVDQTVIIDNVVIHYCPRVNEYIADNITVKLITFHNKRPTAIVSHLFRASDHVVAELSMTWKLNINNGDLKNGLMVEYTCGNKSKKVVLGTLTVYMGGFISSSKGMTGNEGDIKGAIGRSEVEAGSFGTDILCSKYYYPSGNFLLSISPVIKKIEDIRNHLSYNNVNLDTGALFDILSSIPLKFQNTLKEISSEHWRYNQNNKEFIEYISTSSVRNSDSAVNYSDYTAFITDKNVHMRHIRSY